MAIGAALGLMLVAPASASADVAPPANPEPYVVFTAGDSFGSGEGAPDAPGVFSSGGDCFGCVREDWDVRFGLNTIDGVDAERCHRSQASGSGVATRALQQDFPDIFVAWTSVACSGASLVKGGKLGGGVGDHAGGILRDYEGVDQLAGFNPRPARPVYSPQLDQIDSRLRQRPSASRRLDALIVSIGLNDSGFGSLVAACLNAPFQGSTVESCEKKKSIQRFASGRLGLMPDLYKRLDDALRSRASNSADAELDSGHRPAATFMLAPPKAAFKTSTTFCNNEPPFLADFTSFLNKNEAKFVENTLGGGLRGHMRESSEDFGWEFVDNYVNDFIGHAVCQDDRFINQNRDALVSQGEMEEVDPPSWIPFVGASAGIVHPNRRGYEQVGGGLHRELTPKLVERFTPTRAPALTSDNRANGFLLRLEDRDRRATTSGNYFHVDLFTVLDNGRILPVAGERGSRLLGYGTTSSDYALQGRFQARARACGPLSRDASVGCGPDGELKLSTIVPKTPLDVGGGGFVNEGTKLSQFIVSWKHADFLAEYDTTHANVKVGNQTFKVEGKATSLRLVNGRALGSVVAKPKAEPRINIGARDSVEVSVQACNDEIGCSAFSAPVRVRNTRIPKTGPDFEKPELIDPGRIDVRGPVPCDRTPLPFGSRGKQLPARNGSDGPVNLRNERREIIPSCPGDPLVADLSISPRTKTVKPGGELTLELEVNHPRRAVELEDVQIRLVGRGGTVTTLTLDERSGRLTTARGDRTKGPSARLGRDGVSAPLARIGATKLSAGDVQVITDRGTYRRPKGRSRELRLRPRLRLDRDLAGSDLQVEVAATGEDGTQQPFRPMGLIKVAKK